MAYIQKIDVEQAEGALKRIYDAGIKRAGKVYEILKIMSLNPKALNTSMRLYSTLMQDEGPLPPATREMIAVVVSRENRCHY